MKLIAVCSGKGGTGKSCVSAYTAAALAALKKKTLVIDTCHGPGSLDVILGLQDMAVFNLHDVLGNLCDIQKAILPVPGNKSLFLLPAGIPPGKTAGSISFSDMLKAVRFDYDFVIIDNPPEGFNFKAAFMTLLVTTPDTLSVRTAAQKSRELYGYGAKNVRLVINNVPPRVIPMKSFVDFDDLIDQAGARLIAIIPSSGKLQYAANNGLTLSPESLTSQVFNRLAQRIRGRQEPLLIR